MGDILMRPFNAVLCAGLVLSGQALGQNFGNVNPGTMIGNPSGNTAPVVPMTPNQTASVSGGNIETITGFGTVAVGANTTVWLPLSCGDVAFNLPASPINNEAHTIINSGACPTNSLTINGSGHNIGTATSLVGTSPGSVMLRYATASGNWDIGGIAGPNATLPVLNNLVIGSDQFGGAFGGNINLLAGNNVGANSIVGQTVNNLPTNTAAFPAGITGAGRVTTAGNTAFGMFGFAQSAQASGGSVSVGAEFTVSNGTSGPPDTTIPPNTSIGTTTTVPDGLHVTCSTLHGETNNCSIGVYISNDNANPASPIFTTGEYIRYYANNGLFIAAMPSGSQIGAEIQGNGNGLLLQMATSAEVNPSNAAIAQYDHLGHIQFGVTYNGAMAIGNPTGGFGEAGSLNITGHLYVNGVTGVSCSGAPTSGFIATNGVVTHC